MEPNLDWITGLKIRAGDQLWIRVRDQLKRVLIENRRQNDLHFHTRESHTDTVARPTTEREIRVLRTVAFACKPFWTEGFRVVPPRGITVGRPLGQDQGRARWDLVAC